MITLKKPKVIYRELTKDQPDHWTELWDNEVNTHEVKNEWFIIEKMNPNFHLKLEKVITHENGDVEHILLWSNE